MEKLVVIRPKADGTSEAQEHFYSTDGQGNAKLLRKKKARKLTARESALVERVSEQFSMLPDGSLRVTATSPLALSRAR